MSDIDPASRGTQPNATNFGELSEPTAEQAAIARVTLAIKRQQLMDAGVQPLVHETKPSVGQRLASLIFRRGE